MTLAYTLNISQLRNIYYKIEYMVIILMFVILSSLGERRLSWESFLVALTIKYYGKYGQFKNEWQLLNQLMELDAIFIKWRRKFKQFCFSSTIHTRI